MTLTFTRWEAVLFGLSAFCGMVVWNVIASCIPGCASAPPPNAESTVTVDTTVCVLTHYADSADVVSQECAPISNADALKILDAANAMAVRKAAGKASVQP